MRSYRRNFLLIVAIAAVLASIPIFSSTMTAGIESEVASLNIEKSFDEIKWLAVLGDSRAQFLMGISFAFGQGTEKNNSAAIRWFERACSFPASSQCPPERIMYSIAEKYLEVEEINSMVEARWWLKKAADRGSEEARVALANFYQ
jgi:TPR repeat protein